VTKDLFGTGFVMLFSELYKIMVNQVTFVDFRRRGRSTLNPPLLRIKFIPAQHFYFILLEKRNLLQRVQERSKLSIPFATTAVPSNKLFNKIRCWPHAFSTQQVVILIESLI